MALMYDDNGDPYQVAQAVPLTDSDAAEWQKMQAFAPSADNSTPWWTQLVSYGVVKAIDNTFPTATTNIQGNTRPGSFAGQNGQTYSQRGSSATAPVLATGWLTKPNAATGGFSPLVLLVGGLLLAHFLKK